MGDRPSKRLRARRRRVADWLTYVVALLGLVSIVAWNIDRHLPQVNDWALLGICAVTAWAWMALIAWLRGDDADHSGKKKPGRARRLWAAGLLSWRWHRTLGGLPWPGCREHCLDCCLCADCRTERGRALARCGVAFKGPL